MKPRRMQLPIEVIVLSFCSLLLWGCSDSGSTAQHSTAGSSSIVAGQDIPLPEELREGETKFNNFCSRCHGPQGQGTENGPPLVHKIYEPNHHGDMAFQRAASLGVRAHHWKFGNMPKIEGVTTEDVSQIVGYVRWLQKRAGIF